MLLPVHQLAAPVVAAAAAGVSLAWSVKQHGTQSLAGTGVAQHP